MFHDFLTFNFILKEKLYEKTYLFSTLYILHLNSVSKEAKKKSLNSSKQANKTQHNIKQPEGFNFLYNFGMIFIHFIT